MLPTPDPIAKGVWTKLFLLLSLLPIAGMAIDLAYGPMGGIGRTGNMANAFTVFFVIAVSRFLDFVRSPRERMLEIFAVAFVLYTTAVTFSSPMSDPVMAYPGLMALYASIACGLAMLAMEKTGAPMLEWTMKWTVIGILPVIAIPFLAGAMPKTFSPADWTFGIWGFSNIRALGHYCSTAIIVLIGLLAFVDHDRIRPMRRCLGIAALVMLWSVLFWSGSRAGILSIAGSIIIMIIMTRRLRIADIGQALGTMVAGAAISLLYHMPNGNFGIIQRLSAASYNTALADGDINRYSAGRLDLWTWSVETILEKPWFGWGYLPMRRIDGEGAPPFEHAHSVYLDLAMSFGIPAAILTITVCAWIWLRAARATRNNPSRASLAAFMLVTMFPIYASLSAILLSPYFLILMGVCLGGLVGLGAQDRTCKAIAQSKLQPIDTTFI